MSSTAESLGFGPDKHEQKTVSESFESLCTFRTQLSSPLFNLITELKQKSDPLVENIEFIVFNTAFLIAIDPASVHTPLFPSDQYKLISRHFRIDQYCKTNEGSGHGLYPMHYTEQYESIAPEDRHWIVVHGYLNAQGHYLYPQIKRYQDSTCSLLFSTQLTQEQVQNLEQIIIINIHNANAKLHDLINEKKMRTSNLKIEADLHEKELSTLSRSLESQKSIEKYISIANLFIQTIENLNQYSDIPDSRGKPIQNLLNTLSKRTELLKTLNAPKAETIPQVEKKPETTPGNSENVENSPESILETLITETIKTLKHLDKDHKQEYNIFNPNLDGIIRTHQIIETIEGELLLTLFLPKSNCAKQQAILDELYKNLNSQVENHYSKCLKIFDFSARSGNLDTVSRLLPSLESKILEQCKALIESLFSVENQSKLDRIEKIIKVCDYLHNNSRLYNSALMEIIIEKSEKTTLNKMLPLINSDEEVKTSLLYKAYLNKNLNIFEMLLRHGVHPDTWAILSLTHKETKMYTTIQLIAVSKSENYLSYIKTLLKYKANPNLINTNEMALRTNKEKLNNSMLYVKTMTSLPQNQRNKITFKNVETKDYGHHPLIYFFWRQDCEGIDLILPYTDLDILVLFLAQIATQKIFLTRSYLTEQAFVTILDNKESADRICSNNGTSKFDSLSAQIIYPITTQDPEKLKTIENHSKYFRHAQRALIEKMFSLSLKPHFFELAYKKIFDSAMDKILLEENENAYMYLLACDFLFIERYKTLTDDQEKSQELQKYIPELIKKRIEITMKVYSHPLNRDLVNILKNRLTACKQQNKKQPQPTLMFSGEIKENQSPPENANKNKNKK